jgi:hypothetical protein
LLKDNKTTSPRSYMIPVETKGLGAITPKVPDVEGSILVAEIRLSACFLRVEERFEGWHLLFLNLTFL